MSTEKQVVDDSAIEWKTCTSQNGASFRVGAKKADGGIKNKSAEGKEAADITPEQKRPFDISVNWPFSGKDDWIPTPDNVVSVAAITRYRLSPSPSGVFKYRLEITAIEHYDYVFVDATGDKYGLDVWVNGNHFVDFDSENPTITHVKGD